MATLLLSQETPMLLTGDEFGRTQSGNNNASCQDGDISWVDWNIQEKGQRLIRFVRQLIGLRQAHAILRRGRYLRGQYGEALGIKDVTWINASGIEIKDGQWDDAGMKCFGMLIDGRARLTGIRKRGGNATMLLIFNASADGVTFKLPACPGGDRWSLLVDTNQIGTVKGSFTNGDEYVTTGRSTLVFTHPNG